MSHRVKRAESDVEFVQHISSVMKEPGWLTQRVYVDEAAAGDQVRWGLILQGSEIFAGTFELDSMVNREL